MDQQDQIYVLSGVVAGLVLVIFFFIGYLMYRVAKITELLAGQRVEKRDTYAYNNPAIVRGEELNRRGFVMEGSSALNHAGPSAEKRDTLDFSRILNNNETIFGADLPASRPRTAVAQPGLTNENFSFNSPRAGPAVNRDTNSNFSGQMPY